MAKVVKYTVEVTVDEGFNNTDLINHVYTGIKEHLHPMVPSLLVHVIQKEF